MSIVVVVLLVVLWAWILLPGAVREQRDGSPASSVSRYERAMSGLARLNPIQRMRTAHRRAGREVLVPSGPRERSRRLAAARAARRRRTTLAVLVTATAVGLLLARTVGGPAWIVFWLAAVLLSTFLGLLAHRWVQVSREAARPLLGPPTEVTGSGVVGVDVRTDARPSPRPGPYPAELPGDGVRVVDW